MSNNQKRSPFLPGQDDKYKLPMMEVAAGGMAGTSGIAILAVVVEYCVEDATVRRGNRVFQVPESGFGSSKSDGEELFRDILVVLKLMCGCGCGLRAKKETGRVRFFGVVCRSSAPPMNVRRTVGWTQKMLESLRELDIGGTGGI